MAQRLASIYTENPDVKAIIVGGSMARGFADKYSDLEIGFFWSKPPSDKDRKTAIEQMGGDLWSFTSYDLDKSAPVGEHVGLNEIVIDSQIYSGTAFIDSKHFTVEGMETWLSDVTDDLDTTTSFCNPKSGSYLWTSITSEVEKQSRYISKRIGNQNYPRKLVVRAVVPARYL